MPSLGPLEIIVIMAVALLVFGPNKLPEVGRQVGQGMRELRKFQETIRGELNDVMNAVNDSSTAETTNPGTPPSLPPVVSPPGVPGRDDTRPGPTGAHAPSRFRAPQR